VNKVATAVALCFHPASSSALTPDQKELVKARLAGRMNADGVLRLVSASGRSQGVNRLLAEARFREILARALAPVRKRRPTRPTRASRERRLEEKRLLAVRKAARRRQDAV
jgi:ribosome-associated protein